MIASTTLLNRIGADLAKDPDVHAITDVTGFGVLGHGLEVARGSRATAVIRFGDLPLLSRGRAAGARGPGDRRLEAQLAELWRRGRAAGRDGELAAELC